jgi:hypothetical protein
VTYTRCRIDTINSPDDGHMAAQNMERIEMNIHQKELCVKLFIYKDHNAYVYNVGGSFFAMHASRIILNAFVNRPVFQYI